MKIFIIFLTISTLTSALPPSFYPDGRIVGGNATDIEKVPYIASLHYGGIHSCGCIIINNLHVLTAAHCTEGVQPFQLMIRFGSSYHAQHGTVRSVRSIFQHPNYSRQTVDFDFSILRVTSVIPLNERIQPIQLPEVNEKFADGEMMTISGWGLTHNPNEPRNRLRKVDVPIFNQELCRKIYERINVVTDRWNF